MEGQHLGSVLAEHVLEVLEEYEICDKLFCITTDGAGNNGTMCESLSRDLRDKWGIKWNYKQRHIACMNHVINLSVQAFLKSIKGITIDNDDDDIDFAEELVNEEPGPDGFARALWKIRSFTKVSSKVMYKK